MKVKTFQLSHKKDKIARHKLTNTRAVTTKSNF